MLRDRQDNAMKNATIRNSLQILTLYFLTVLVVYKLPGVIGHLLFLVYFYFFYKSKKDYFWLAFWILLNTGPGGFFYYSETVTTGQLPIFKLGGGVNIVVTEIFLAIAIFKALTRGKKQPILLKKPLILILVYSLFLFMVSLVVFGTPMIRFLKDLRYFFYYFSIIPFSYLIYKEKEVEKIIYCLFPFVFVTFVTAMYYVFTGNYFINLLAPGLREQVALGIEEGGMRYNISGKGEHLIVFISFIISLFFTIKNTTSKKKNKYLLLVAVISYVIILLSATRIWFVVFTFIFLGTLIFIQKKLKVLSLTFLLAIVFCIPYFYVPKIHDFTNRAWKRIESVFEVNRAGSIAYDTIEFKKRFRLAKTLEGIEKSPLIGLGVSEQFYEYTRGTDIGNFTLILQIGIIGFLLFVNFWLQFFYTIKKINSKLSSNNPYHRVLFFFSIVLIGLLIAHFTTHQVFSMVMSQAYTIFIMFFIFLCEYFSRDALRLENSLKNPANTIKPQEVR